MANAPKPWKVEYAKSSRAGCKTCKTTIGKEKLRLGKMIQATQFDGFIPVWHHASCIMKKSNQIKSIDDVEGAEVLRWEDQQKLRAYVETLGFSSTATAADIFTAQNIEISKTSRATCKMCNQKIVKGEVRVSTKPQSQVERGLSWQHANCFIKISPSIEVEKLSGWKELSASDKAALLALVKPSSAAEDKNIPQQSKTKGGSKRKSNVNCDGHVKAVKVEGDSSKNRKVFIDEPEERGMKQKGSDLERRLEAQSKDLWALKDDLKEHVSTLELKEMLGANDQDTSGSELDLRDRCADGMLFGALGTCPQCSGGIRYSGGMYKCLGYISEWSKCSYVTNKPHRIKGKWKIPNESHNKYLLKWSKLQKITKPTRVLPPSTKPPGNPSESLRNETLGDLRVALTGFSEESVENWKRKIEEASGLVHVKTKKDTTCLVVCGAPGDSNNEIKKAKMMNVGIVTEDYLVKCFEKSRKLALDAYRIECVEERVTVRVKGRSAVHESSGLQDSCHILEDGKSVYNTTLNLSDLSTGVNSYYILQIIKEDKGSDCYVFRKWGRIGNEKIGGKKIEEMSGEEDAVVEFKRLFLEKTGNPWEAWEEKDKFVKQAGRFYPLDIDYGADKGKPKGGLRQSSSSLLLSSPVVELMNMLFNVETYRATLMEFEINMNEMPLGKISKLNIQKGFEALTAIQNLLESSGGGDPAAEESLLVDASNRFFMMIPSIHPHIIREEYELKSKLKMLEALQDIEIASRLVGFDDDGGESLEHKYEKLQCAVLPVPHDTEDYRLIDKYLQMTHAPTHRDWTLELEDVFSLERQGEGDKYAATRSKLKNRMLLWHGSRVTNFVGILSQGLRIAPPEAPATGYMFGKGVYFADMASKSAQYCFTSKNSPVGLMLLSEVALGDIHPLKKATYMDKAPRGKHSTKGLGKTIPRESNFMTWRDGVIVPCGEPVPSNVRATELQYNEYIVYDTSQVKMQFLLKVRFHHKR